MNLFGFLIVATFLLAFVGCNEGDPQETSATLNHVLEFAGKMGYL